MRYTRLQAEKIVISSVIGNIRSDIISITESMIQDPFNQINKVRKPSTISRKLWRLIRFNYTLVNDRSAPRGQRKSSSCCENLFWIYRKKVKTFNDKGKA